MIVIGIDPGKSGGLVVINSDEVIPEKKVSLHKCPSSTHGMSAILRQAKSSAWIDEQDIHIAIEKVWAFPTDARSSAFKFGVNYGMWLGIIGSLNLPFMEVPPQTWMKAYEKLPKDKKERKKAIKDIATNILHDMFDNKQRVTYAVSDAALIALWCLERKKSYAIDER